MNEIPFNMFGYPIGPSYLPAEPTNVGISQLELDREYSHSRQREAYLEAHRVIVEESYNVVKACKGGKERIIRFGDPNMTIKKSNPKRRKSFRARHKCDTAKDKFSARYWSCKKW